MNSRFLRTFVLGLLLCTVLAAAAFAGGPTVPVVSANVQVNDPQQLFPNDFPSRNSATLAVSDDGSKLLAGWDDFQGFCGPPTGKACPPPSIPGVSGYGFSLDGGATWTDGISPEPIGTAQTAGHPWVDRGTDNKHHEAFFFTSRMRVANTGSAGIGVYRGHFGAGTFVFDDAQLLAPIHTGDFYSRQAIAAAKDNTRAAYIVQSNIIAECDTPAFGFGQIEVFRTHDGGNTWSDPVVVSADITDITDVNDPLCGATGTQQVAPAPAIGPDGEVYLVWQFGPVVNADGSTASTSSLGFSRSFDGGAHFSDRKLIVTYNNMREDPPVGYAKNRMNDQPRIAVAQSGAHRGRVYVTFYQPLQPVQADVTEQSLVSSQIYIMYSDTRGRTWSTPKPILGPVPDTGLKRFWPTPAVRPNGDLDIIYLESQEKQVTPDPTDIECSVLVGGGLKRTGTASSIVDTWWVQSRDGGVTFGTPVKISSESGNWCLAAYQGVGGLYSNFGDYLGIGAANNRTFALWPDGRNGFSDIFFAKVKNRPPFASAGNDSNE